MVKKIAFGALVFMVVIWFAVSVSAAVYTVDDDGPADFSSIQAAINFAGNGVVDGADLADFADDFGRIDCLDE